MTDDVKVLREAAEDLEKIATRFGELTSVEKASLIVFNRTADAIEREEGNTILGMPVVVRDDAPPGMLAFVQDGKLIGGIKDINPSALSEAEDRGWNAAIEAAAKHCDASLANKLASRIRGLKRPHLICEHCDSNLFGPHDKCPHCGSTSLRRGASS